MLPKSELPPTDKMPWWQDNPLLLEGSDAKKLDVDGHPTKASRVVAAMYEKGECRVAIFCLTYQSAEDASAEYSVFKRELSPNEELLGFVRGRKDAIVMMVLPASCPDRSFFANHFDAIAHSEQATQSAPDAR
jgi:hypothetical protein